MIRILKITVLALALALPGIGLASSLQEAADRVAREHDARVLSAQTEERGGQSVHIIRILTRDGVVRTVRVPASGSQARPHSDPRNDRDGRQIRPAPRDRAPPGRDGGQWSAPPRSREGPRAAPRSYRDEPRAQPEPRLLRPRERQGDERREFREPERDRGRSRSRGRDRDDGRQDRQR